MQPAKLVIDGTELLENLRLVTLFCHGRRQVGKSSQWVE